MVDSRYTTHSDIIETFDREENQRLLKAQLEALHNDACESFIDNFKILYQRFVSIRDGEGIDQEVKNDAQAMFLDICLMFIENLTDEMGITLDENYLETHEGDWPAIALQLYVFFVLDLRSNLFNVLLSYISKHITEIAAHFEELRQRKDSITEVNRSLVDQNVALVASNIYDVVDWAMEQLDADSFFEQLEDGYVMKLPMLNMYNQNIMNGAFVDTLRNLMRENLDLKARISFDIICRLKGFK